MCVCIFIYICDMHVPTVMYMLTFLKVLPSPSQEALLKKQELDLKKQELDLKKHKLDLNGPTAAVPQGSR